MLNRTLVAVAVILVSQAVAAVAQTPQSGWIADTRTGCKVWSYITSPQLTVTWTGECANGLAQGHGVAQWFMKGQPADSSDGDYRDGKRYGLGANTWPNGNRYEGEYRDGLRSGHGIYTTSDGHRYEGDFRDGLPNGYGVYTTPHGRVFKGVWFDGCYRDGERKAVVLRAPSSCP